MQPFHTEGNKFVLNGQPIRIISGAIHYFRVVPEYWRDRLEKLKACGFNTVETYIAWNVHEPEPGAFCFEGGADLVKFITTAQELGLYVIVRPSPYICAEWEFGGLPAWLLAEPSMRLRCAYPPFLAKVDAYYDVLMPLLQPLLCTQGGPIIAMQIENEYGSYGNDKAYLEHLKASIVSHGIDVQLFTSDGPGDFMLQGGMIPGVLETVNFGSHAKAAFQKLKEYQPDHPLMCMEFWNGWFDHWGETHHTRDAVDVAAVVREMMENDASVNFYMFHGGTNFGFYNGANYSDKYEPTTTSYDYDSLLDESGAPTDKFFAVREVLAEYLDLAPITLPKPIPKKGFGTVQMTEQAPLWTSLPALSTAVQCAYPETMERLGQNYGFILYTTHISGPRSESELVIQDVHDRALVFVDGVYQGVIERWNHEAAVRFAVPSAGVTVSILVENMGRINYGPHLRDSKGITEGVRFGQQFLFDWRIHPLPLNDLSGLQFAPKAEVAPLPTFYRGVFEVDHPADTFLDTCGWSKGVAYINGFNLGRYWHIGPQQTLYVPGPKLRRGENELILFELHEPKTLSVSFGDKPVFETGFVM